MNNMSGKHWVKFVRVLIVMWLLAALASQIQAQGLPLGTNLAGTRLDWQPNGIYLAIASANVVSIIDTNTGQVVNTLPAMHEMVTAVKWDHSGNRLAIAAGLTIQVWRQPWDTQQQSASTLLNVPIATSRIYYYGISSIDWHPNDQLLLGVVYPDTHIWDLMNQALVQTIASVPVEAAGWDVDGQYLAVTHLHGGIYVYPFINNRAADRTTMGVEFNDRNGGTAIAWHPVYSKLAAANASGIVSEVLIDQGFLSLVFPRIAQSSFVLSLAWHPVDANLLASGDAAGLITLFRTPYMDIVRQWQSDGPVVGLDWSRDGRYLAYGTADGYALADAIAYLPTATPTITPSPTPQPSATPLPPPIGTPFPFQQNPCTFPSWLLEPGSLGRIVEVEEAAADMFLNWVYWRNDTQVAFSDMLWRSAACYPDGCPDPGLSGQARSTWMDQTMADLFTEFRW
jgi:hypothetical protein